VDEAVAKWRCEGVVDASVLVEERQSVECGRHDSYLEVISGTGSILDLQVGRLGERLLEQRADGLGLHATMLDAQGYPGDMRFVRALLLLKVGFWTGMLASAALMKRVLQSRGDADSDEVALVAILDGVELESHAQAFRGGSMVAWLGGIAVDLREAHLAPDAHLDVTSVFGGIAIRVPPDWRIESNVRALGGGVAVGVPELQPADAPTLRLDGFSAFGGVAIGAKPGDDEF
jgi:hypothetical protein